MDNSESHVCGQSLIAEYLGNCFIIYFLFHYIYNFNYIYIYDPIIHNSRLFSSNVCVTIRYFLITFLCLLTKQTLEINFILKVIVKFLGILVEFPSSYNIQVVHNKSCQIWTQRGSDWPQMGQFRDFFKSCSRS